MNTFAADTIEVKSDQMDDTAALLAAEDDAFTAWLEANADRLAEESEAASMIESNLRHF